MAINTMKKFTSKLIIFLIFSVPTILMIKKYRANQKSFHSQVSNENPKMKYILLWTKAETIPFLYIGQGRSGFIERECAYTNCIMTGNKSMLGSTTAFDAVLFHGPELVYSNTTFPKERSPHQKFVFASIESPVNYPLCKHNFNGYFNWTWTYKLDSDIRWGYIAIKDSNGNIVGPKKDMNWIKWQDMERVNETMKNHLQSKNRAVAWFVSNCRSASHRENYVNNLKHELKRKYDLDIDVFGECGYYKCNRTEHQFCDALISKHYYFYLAFENAFSEDYVTEKLLHAVQNNAVPIVYGGANYSRFLPERSYLNARELNVPKLAQLIHQLIREPALYVEFFRWKKYYTYHKTDELKETNEYCKMCEALNDDKLLKTTSEYSEFSDFWEVYKTC